MDLLLQLLAKLHPDPAELIDFNWGRAASLTAPRLRAYWTARDQFIAAGRNIPKTRDPALLLRYAEAPLLDAVRISPDFDPAYNPLLSLARTLVKTVPGIESPKPIESAGSLNMGRMQGPRRIPVEPGPASGGTEFPKDPNLDLEKKISRYLFFELLDDYPHYTYVVIKRFQELGMWKR